jgi:hypothetical protein
MAFKLSNRILRDYIQSLNVPVATGNVRLVGIRGAVPYTADGSGTSISLRDNALDHWNDTIGIWGGEWALYTATVEPGSYYTENPLDADGAAHLLGLENGGQPWRFKWGKHKGTYEALVQAEPFTVQRDKNRNGRPDPGEPKDIGDFGIHIHWGGKGWSVGRWSAGCQVLFGGDSADSPWREFRDTLKASGQKEFVYYLIDGRKLAQSLGLL